MVNGHGLNLKSTVALAPNRRVVLSFDTLKPGIDFSSTTVKVLGGVFF